MSRADPRFRSSRFLGSRIAVRSWVSGTSTVCDRCGAVRTAGSRRFVEETAGGYFELKDTDDLGPTFTRVAQELHSQYVVGLAPSVQDRKLHELEVRVKERGMTARAQDLHRANRPVRHHDHRRPAGRSPPDGRCPCGVVLREHGDDDAGGQQHTDDPLSVAGEIELPHASHLLSPPFDKRLVRNDRLQ